jgi:hypothetical protein
VGGLRYDINWITVRYAVPSRGSRALVDATAKRLRGVVVR